MNREFLRHYERELTYLYDHAEEFAQKYPGIAERLGGLSKETVDPGIAGLVEGAAFLAARVQMKLDSQFFEFSSEVLEQLLPGMTAPTPSCALLGVEPEYANRNLKSGKHFKAGSYADANYMEQDRNVSCRFRLSADLSIFPVHLAAAKYHSGTASLQALGLEVASETRAGLQLTLRHRISKLPKGKEKDTDAGAPLSEVEMDSLPIHFVGPSSDVAALYEQMFTQRTRVWVRWLDEFETPHFIALSDAQIEQLGFEDNERIASDDQRMFPAFGLLRDFFLFPDKFFGMRLVNLRPLLQKIPAKEIDIIVEFDKSVARMQAAVQKSLFRLYIVPATNLFEMRCSRIPISNREHEHNIVPDRSRWTDFEVHEVLSVFAHYQGARDKTAVYPIYRLPVENIRAEQALYHSIRRVPRRPTQQEKRFGTTPEYMGADVFLTLREPVDPTNDRSVKELSVKALCSNRHLPAQLPVGQAGADFTLVDDTKVALTCVSGPTPPRESIVTMERQSDTETGAPYGSVLWRIINYLNFNHLGIASSNGEDSAKGLREILALFGDLSSTVTERQIRGIVAVNSRPVVRKLRQATGFNAARGVEIVVTFDEKAFEGTGIVMYGAVLDRFFAQYSTINSFTQTVVKSTSRGIVKRWPPRAGLGQVL